MTANFLPAPRPEISTPPTAAPCFHGGAFFEGIGDGFEDLGRRREVVNADVLDAWFPPAPAVRAALREHLAWLLRTSPPTHAAGLTAAIARARGVPAEGVLAGAGSSALLFLALREWLPAGARVLLPVPAYGEYAHVLERVIGCRVSRLFTPPGEDLDPERLARACRAGTGFDAVILINPNNPTGRHLPRAALEPVLAGLPRRTLVWVDEAYLEYVGAGESLERFAAASARVVVCKTFSKVYALSGLRAAYLCGPPALLAPLRALVPPWAVGLPAQVAAVRALDCTGYYEGRWAQTHRLRDAQARRLGALGLDLQSAGRTNSLLLRLPDGAPDAAEVLARCRAEDVFLRGAAGMGLPAALAARTVRVAVKDTAGNRRVAAVLRAALSDANAYAPSR